MPTALLTHKQHSPNEQVAHHLPVPIPSTEKRVRHNNLDLLLNQSPASQRDIDAQTSLEPDAAPGIFLALRVALLFNAGLGITALLAYEAWTLLAL